MTNIELKGRLLGLDKTPETIEVRDKQNCQTLAGCIVYLEKMADEINADTERVGEHASNPEK